MRYTSLLSLLLAAVLSSQLIAAAPVGSPGAELEQIGERDMVDGEQDLIARSPLMSKFKGSKSKQTSSSSHTPPAQSHPLPPPSSPPRYGSPPKDGGYPLPLPPPPSSKGKGTSSSSGSGGYTLPRPGKAQPLQRPPPPPPNAAAWPSQQSHLGIQELHSLPRPPWSG